MSLSVVRSAHTVASAETTKTLTISCTATESNRILLVYVSYLDGVQTGTPVPSMDYDSVAMTKEIGVVVSTIWGHDLFYMEEADLPASGNADIDLTFTRSVYAEITAVLVEAEGVIDRLDSSSASSGSGTTLDNTFDNTGKVQTNTLVIDCTAARDNNAGIMTWSPDDSQTEIVDSGRAFLQSMVVGEKDVSSSSTFTQSYTASETGLILTGVGIVLDHATTSTDWSAVINDSLVIGGSGQLNTVFEAVVNDALVFGGTGSLSQSWEAIINDTLVFGGTGALSRDHLAVINDALTFGGTGVLNKALGAVINDALVFGGTGLIGNGWSVVINDGLVFSGSGVIGRQWDNVESASSLSWGAVDTASSTSWSNIETSTSATWTDTDT